MDEDQPNFVSLAKSYGIKGIKIKTASELQEALDTHKNESYPILFDFVVVENENCYPMVHPGTTNAAMSGIRYQSEELRILEHHTDLDVGLKEFLSIKTDETRAAEDAEAAGIPLPAYDYDEYEEYK